MSAASRSKSGIGDETGRLTPGAHLRAEIERLGLDQVAVSKATGVSRQSVNNIVNGRQPISRAMAGKLGRLTGRGSDYWLGEWFDETGPGTSVESVSARSSGAGLLVNHQIERAVKDGIIGLKPFEPQNLRAASIELTLSGFVTLVDGRQVSIARAKGFALLPGATVHAATLEIIELPHDYYGRAGAAHALSRHGVIASADFQIEPGFKGRLRFHLFNAGRTPYQLRAGDPAIGLEIGRLAVTPDVGAKPKTTSRL